MGEKTMNRRNGSTAAPPNGVAKGMGELTRDIVSLAVLELELFKDDCRQGLKRMLNRTWIRRALKRPASIESQQPEDR